MINGDESDLTEIEDSEDEQPLATSHKPAVPNLPSSPLKADNKKSKNGPRLQEPHYSTVSVKSIYDELKSDIIDVNPEYQRCVVWNDAKQGALIDSLMHNYVVFPLVFAEREGEDGVKIRVCIDGKQRITAIQQFIEGKISYRDSQLNREMWYGKVPAGKKGLAFNKAQRQRFDHTTISTCRYSAIHEHDEREVFQRVQNGVALSTHERLKSINGPNADLVRDMYRRISRGLQELLGWENAKGKDFFMLGQIAVMIKENSKKLPGTQITLTRVESFLGLKTAPPDELRLDALHVIDVFNKIHESPQLMDVFESIQPQFFVMAGIVIHLHKSTYSVAQLADVVRKMKALVKADTAAKLYKKLLAFVTKEVHSLDLKGESLNVGTRRHTLPKNVRAPAVQETPAPSASIGPKRTVQATPKRKRAVKADDDDGDYGADSPEAGTQLTKRRKPPTLKYSDDEDYPVVKRNPPKILVTSRRSISGSVAAKSSGSISRAQTKVKSRATTTTASSTSLKNVNQTQVGQPTMKPSLPTRTKNPTTAGAVTMSATRNKGVSSQQNEALGPGKSYMPTPPTSVSNPSHTPPPPSTVSSASALSRPPSRLASQLFDDDHDNEPFSIGCTTNRPEDNIHIKTELRNSPVTSHQTSPVSQDRLGPIWKAKQKILDQAVDSRSRSRQPSQQSQPPTPKDHEADFQFQIDQIGSTLRSPVASTWPCADSSKAPSPSSPIQQRRPRTPAALTSGDVIMVDGTKDKSVLCGAPSFERRDDPVPPRKSDKPALQQKPTSHLGVPSTNVDQLSGPSTSTTLGPATSGNPNNPPPQPQPPSAAVIATGIPSGQKVPYRHMAPIPKLPLHPTPTMPARAPTFSRLSDAQQRTSTARTLYDYEKRHYRPPSGYNPQRERSQRD